MKQIFGLFGACLMVLPVWAGEVTETVAVLPAAGLQVIEEGVTPVDTSSVKVAPVETQNTIEDQTEPVALPSDFVFAGFTSGYFSKFQKNLESQGVDGKTALMLTEVVRNRMNMPLWKEKIVKCIQDFGTTQSDEACFSDFASESDHHLEAVLNSL